MYPKHMTTKDTIRVLLVDDMASELEMIKLLLHDSDANLLIDTTTSPLHAYELAMNLEYDCLVTDYNMPTINGLQLTKMIHERNDTPIIMLTGLDDEAVAEACFKEGVMGYFRKGPDISIFTDLAKLIRRIVEDKRLVTLQS